MPGQKDTISVKIDGRSVIFQKLLIMRNLKEMYSKFCDENPEMKISLNKFCSLRPRHLAGGTHIFCVCPIHENIKLMAIGSSSIF